jgi:integrase
VAKAAPATVHVSLAALAALGECLGRGAPDVARVDRPARAPRALGEDEVRRLLRAARRTRRDPGPGAARAVLSGTGLRPAEAAALDVDDVPTTERTGAVHVRAGKGERPRTVPLPTDARRLLRRWLTERARHPAARRGEPAL